MPMDQLIDDAFQGDAVQRIAGMRSWDVMLAFTFLSRVLFAAVWARR